MKKLSTAWMNSRACNLKVRIDVLLSSLKFDSNSISSTFKHFTKFKSSLLIACNLSINCLIFRKKWSIFDCKFKYFSIKITQASEFANNSKKNRISLLHDNTYRFMLLVFWIPIKTFEFMRFSSKKLKIRIVVLSIDIRLISDVDFLRNSLKL